MRQKRGATLTIIVLMIGVLFITFAVLTSLRKVYFQQARWVEEDVAAAILDHITEQVENTIGYSQDTSFEIEMPYTEEYVLEASTAKLSLFLPRRNIEVSRPFLLPNVNVLDSSVANSGKIFIYIKDSQVLITDELICNVNDNVCDVACLIQGICDPDCYKDNLREGVCNHYCIDMNNDELIDYEDMDLICDPDCYNNQRNLYYDVDCVKSDDGVCEVDSHLNPDAICDFDCLGTNGVCDPDCEADDADCPRLGNKECEFDLGENCLNAPQDCSCGLGKTCRVTCGLNTDERGCVKITELVAEKGSCQISCECIDGLRCDYTGHCCAEGHYGQSCEDYTADGICSTLSPDPFDLPSENCQNSDDCSCASGEVCCIAGGDDKGCAPIKPKLGPNQQADDCICNNQCQGGTCTSGKCCENGFKWDGSKCAINCNSCETELHAQQCPYCNCIVNPKLCKQNEVCCPGATKKATGCISGPTQSEGQQCKCTSQCKIGVCNNNHCCPMGYTWDGNSCKEWMIYYAGNPAGVDMPRGDKCGSPTDTGQKGRNCVKQYFKNKNDCTRNTGVSKLNRVAKCINIPADHKWVLFVFGDIDCESLESDPDYTGNFDGIYSGKGTDQIRIYADSGNQDHVNWGVSQTGVKCS